MPSDGGGRRKIIAKSIVDIKETLSSSYLLASAEPKKLTKGESTLALLGRTFFIVQIRTRVKLSSSLSGSLLHTVRLDNFQAQLTLRILTPFFIRVGIQFLYRCLELSSKTPDTYIVVCMLSV